MTADMRTKMLYMQQVNRLGCKGLRNNLNGMKGLKTMNIGQNVTIKWFLSEQFMLLSQMVSEGEENNGIQ